MSSIKALQDYIFTSKYARWIPSKNRRETYSEAVDRVRDMMFAKYLYSEQEEEDPSNDKLNQLQELIEEAYDAMRKKRILGSQRALQFGGDPILKKNARIFNCCYSHCDRPRFFQEYLWLLLCGCGAGFSVQKHHVAKLPKLADGHGPPRKIKTFVIPDTIEGWADALGILLTTFFQTPTDPKFSEWSDAIVEFDFSRIRPKGSTLSSGVGKAPGPEGLKNALDKITDLLVRCWSRKQDKLKPIDVYDICMHTADAVLSGGVRRSATIALFSPDDKEMAEAKTGNWFVDNPQRARSNNSAVLVRDQITKEQFAALMENVKQFGEPGFVWVESPEAGFNPCVEIQFFPYYAFDKEKFNAWKEKDSKAPITGDPAKIGLESCWHFCNLSTTNCSKLVGNTKEEKIEYFLDSVRASAIVGTLQAGFTSFPYLKEASELLAQEEALLGVSMTGIMDNYEIILDPEVQKQAAKLVLETNKLVADLIGINPCARGTCLKPEGTGTLILGSSAHGCHPHHYIRYLRAVQANTEENVYKYFKAKNGIACEPSKWSANKTDDIVFFPIEVPDGAKTKNQLPAVEMLKIVKSTQQNWVKYGKRKSRCVVPWLEHNVSNTVTIGPDEWDEVTDYIYSNRKYFAGISLVPDSADKDYPQAPNCAVYTATQIVREYGDAALWTSGLIELAIQGWDGDLWDACAALVDDSYKPINFDHGTHIEYDADEFETASKRKRFWEKSRKFADKYFDSDYRRLSYAMKDVYNWKKWTDLKENMVVVDYTKLEELQDNTRLEEEVACAGGACRI